LAGCAACVAGMTSLGPASSAARAAEGGKAKVRLVFSHCKPDEITWPNIGYDYDGRAKQLLAQLTAMCPDVDFLPVHILNKDEADKVFADDAQVDGYLLYVLGMRGGAPALTEKVGKAGRPMIVVDDLYAGPTHLGFNGRAEKAGWKSVCLSTTRMSDIGEAVRCFSLLKKPGATADAFAAAAKAAFQKNIAKMGDLTCCPDQVAISDIGSCLDKLRKSTIVIVGGGMGADPAGLKAIKAEYGVTVVPITLAELHQAYLAADQKLANGWADKWINGAEKVIEPKREELVKSGAMQEGMQAILKKYDARAITINCLGGFYSGQLQAFPCMGFVELNNTGFVGACEGDLPSTLTMLVMGYLTGRPGFISDPVIDTSQNQIVYAHCVAPTKVFGPQGAGNPYHIRDHSEDRKGAAVRSLLPLGYMTSTLKFIPGRREVVFHQGKSVANIDEDKACRTKLAAELKGDCEKLMAGWRYGWHRVTYYGDLKQPLGELAKALNIKIIEEA
jgi:hypothetical protein